MIGRPVVMNPNNSFLSSFDLRIQFPIHVFILRIEPGTIGEKGLSLIILIERLRFTNNGSLLKNPEIPGATTTLSLSILILNSQCVEGARDFRVL